jgi:hypothetical protein
VPAAGDVPGRECVVVADVEERARVGERAERPHLGRIEGARRGRVDARGRGLRR